MMQKYFVCLFMTTLCLASFADTSGQKLARAIKLQGAAAANIISILVTANPSLAEHLRSSGEMTAVNLSCLKSATFKYDEGVPLFKLDLFNCHASLKGDSDSVTLSEATALYAALKRAGVSESGSMQGTDVNVADMSCAVNGKLPFSDAHRFSCTLKL